MEEDPTLALPADSNVFRFGDRTILQLNNQPSPFAEPPAQDPMGRMEEKLDTALRMIAAMQQRIESLDATLARVLSR